MISSDDQCVSVAFVYVDAFGPLQKAQINLCSAIRCFYSDGVLVANKGEVLPDGFWQQERGENAGKWRHDDCVTDVSLVVGENGTGKTSLARFWAELCSRPERLKKFVVVYRAGGWYFCRYKGCRVKTTGDVKLKAERYEGPGSAFQQDVRFLYVTPHFSLHSIYENIDDVFAVDLSTHGLLMRRQWFDADRDRSERNRDPWMFERFERDEQCRMFRLLADVYDRCGASELQEHHIPVLRGLLVSVDVFDVGAAQAYVDKAYRRAKKIPELREYREDQKTVAKLADRLPDWFIRVFFAYALCYWHEHDICGDLSCTGGCYGVRLARFAAKLVKDHGIGTEEGANDVDVLSIRTEILAFVKSDGPRYDENGEPMDYVEAKTDSPDYLFFSSLADLMLEFKPNRHAADQFMPIRSETQREKARSLLRAYMGITGVCDFLNFGFYPRLSAGQEALLAMWSRVYDWFVNPKRLKTPKDYQLSDPACYDPNEMSAGEFFAMQEPVEDVDNVVVFFDEAETSLHPDWQRRMISDMLWFMRRFGWCYHVQVVFATHSPILLSDVPMGNAAFLGVDDSFARDLKRLRNTFSANIFDLYRLPFALRDGTTGEFSRRKVAGLIEAVKNGEELSSADRALWRIIGDDFLRGCMNSVSKGKFAE